MTEEKELITTNELLTRIDERVTYIRDINMKEITRHLETLNNNVAHNTERSISNKTHIRNLWLMIGIHLGLLGTIIGLLIHYQ